MCFGIIQHRPNPSCPHSQAEAAPNTAWQEEELGSCSLALVPSSHQDTLVTLPGETWHSAVPEGWEQGRALHPCRQQQLQAWGRARSQFTARSHTLCDCEFLFLTQCWACSVPFSGVTSPGELLQQIPTQHPPAGMRWPGRLLAFSDLPPRSVTQEKGNKNGVRPSGERQVPFEHV